MGSIAIRVATAAGFLLALAGANEARAAPPPAEPEARDSREDCPERKILLSEDKWVKPELGKKKRRYVRM